MDEQQIMQILNQIPLDVLQQYVAERTQQEQSMAGAPAEAMAPQQAMMAYGGYTRGWSPYVDIYACGGSTRSIPRGTLGSRVHKKKR